MFNYVFRESLPINESRMPFKQMENIGRYLEGMRGKQCPTADLFQTIDLYEAKNMHQVTTRYVIPGGG